MALYEIVFIAVAVLILGGLPIPRTGASVDAGKLGKREILARVRLFIDKPLPSGVSYDEANLLGKQSIPILEDIIFRSRFERSHSRVIAALGAIGDARALPSLESYVDLTKGEISLARFDAILVAQSAIGLLAAHDDTALNYLLRRTDVEFWEKQSWTFKGAGDGKSVVMVRAVMNGLGLSGREEARKRLEELSQKKELIECAKDNITLNLRIALNAAGEALLSGGEVKVACSDGTTSGSEGSSEGANPTGSQLVVHPVTISRHVDTMIDEARVRGSFIAASNLLKDENFKGDVACNVELRLNGRVEDFGAQKDADNVITCPSQLRRVLCKSGTRVKLVTSLVGTNLCETTGYGKFAGCAEEPGLNIIMGDPMSGGVLAHEFGHNKGLPHRDDSERRAIMNSTASGTNGVDADECEAFRKGGIRP